MFRNYLNFTINNLKYLTNNQIKLKNLKNLNSAAYKTIRCPYNATFKTFSTSSTEISAENLGKIEYNEFTRLIKDNKDNNTVIIDVREPEELIEHGALPRYINIPLGEVENALKMSNKEFTTKYGHNKPSPDTPIIFSCMRGMRSEKAQIVALQLNYKNVKNYIGGWTDWAEKIR